MIHFEYNSVAIRLNHIQVDVENDSDDLLNVVIFLLKSNREVTFTKVYSKAFGKSTI